MVRISGLETQDPGSNLPESTIGIRQEGHPEFKVLQCAKKSLVQKEGDDVEDIH